MKYQVQLAASARRAIEAELPEGVAAAVFEFLRGPLSENPQRVGKPLGGELAGRWSARRGEYRVVYRIDEANQTVMVIRISHRRAISTTDHPCH